MKAVIFGNNRFADQLQEQYRSCGWDSVFVDGNDYQSLLQIDGQEYCFLASEEFEAETEADSRVLSALEAFANDCETRGCQRLVCHLLLRSNTTLKMLQTMPWSSAVDRVFDVIPFTRESYWARRLFVTVGSRHKAMLPLDFQPIGMESQQHVHLVIIGSNAMAEQVAMTAARVAHYPNYVRDHRLRTRITWVDTKADELQTSVCQRYESLFDNSFYRFVDLSKDPLSLSLHRPIYENDREDFVDVEWEFVKGTSQNGILRQKLVQWAQDPSQLLTIVICGDDDDLNLDAALVLPSVVYSQGVRVAVQCHHDKVVSLSSGSKLFATIVPFGMDVVPYDISLPLVRMAKLLNYTYSRIASYLYDGEHLPTSMPMDEAEALWKELSVVNKAANLYNAMTFATKMNSLGHDMTDTQHCYALSNQEIEDMAETEHNRWCVERLLAGFRPANPVESAEIEKDIKLKRSYRDKMVHYDLRSFSELRTDDLKNDPRIYDKALLACIPLVYYSTN